MQKILKGIIGGVAGYVASILLILILLLTSIELVAFDIGYYKREYAKLGRAEAIGISEEELLESTEELLNYLKDKRDDLHIVANIRGEDRPLFNQRELDHMIDVKNLFQMGWQFRNLALIAFVLLVALLAFLYRGQSFEKLAKAFVISAISLAALSALLIFLIQGDFTRYWDQFHYIFFTNDLWQLDPRTDILIQMVPEQFFYDTVMRILTFFLGGMAVLAIMFGSVLAVREKP